MAEDEIAALRAEVSRLEAELRASRAMHAATIESLPFDFWARDREGYCVSQNNETRAKWGELIGTRPEDVELPADVIATWRENNRRAMAGEVVRGNVDYVVAGEVRHIHNILAPIRQGDDIVGTLGVNIDLTDLRRAEAERLRLERRLREAQRLETVGLLAGGVAHDINNIVMIILGMTSLARRHVPTSSKLDEDLSTIETASRRAAAICTQLLAFAGKGQLALELLDLAAVVTETAKLVHSTLPPEVELHIARPPAEPIAIEIDASQLRALVMNLILNAAEAIGVGAGRIAVAVEPADPELVTRTAANDVTPALDPSRAYVLLTVADTGCGMTPETMERIFEPFFTTKARGRGLGLAATLGTARAHGGAVHVESAPGRGSTFRVFLPRASRALTTPANIAPAEDWRGSGTALIVDDHEGVATATARMARVLGYETVVASSGAEALARLAELPSVAVVMLDLMMPGLDGRTTLERIRQTHPSLPVVLMSGFHDLAEPPVATPLLRKPFGLAELTAALREAMRQS